MHTTTISDAIRMKAEQPCFNPFFLFQFFTGKSTLSLVSFANYEWFEEWKDDKVTNRGTDYKELKQTFCDSILEVVMSVFPKITRDKVEHLARSY